MVALSWPIQIYSGLILNQEEELSSNRAALAILVAPYEPIEICSGPIFDRSMVNNMSIRKLALATCAVAVAALTVAQGQEANRSSSQLPCERSRLSFSPPLPCHSYPIIRRYRGRELSVERYWTTGSVSGTRVSAILLSAVDEGAGFDPSSTEESADEIKRLWATVREASKIGSAIAVGSTTYLLFESKGRSCVAFNVVGPSQSARGSVPWKLIGWSCEQAGQSADEAFLFRLLSSFRVGSAEQHLNAMGEKVRTFASAFDRRFPTLPCNNSPLSFSPTLLCRSSQVFDEYNRGRHVGIQNFSTDGSVSGVRIFAVLMWVINDDATIPYYSTEQAIRGIQRMRIVQGASKMDAAVAVGSTTYLPFEDSGKSCIAFDVAGPSKRAYGGYPWTLQGFSCQKPGLTADERFLFKVLSSLRVGSTEYMRNALGETVREFQE